MGDMDLKEDQDIVVPSTPPVSSEKMSDVDVLTLALAKSRSRAALAEAKASVAQSEKAELDYRYTVLQLYRKYSLSDSDAFSEDGSIVRGGSLQKGGQ